MEVNVFDIERKSEQVRLINAPYSRTLQQLI